MSTPVSRRTVARGAAWTVPVVALGAAAPALAASPGPKPPVPATVMDVSVLHDEWEPVSVRVLPCCGKIWPEGSVMTIRRASGGEVLHTWQPPAGTAEQHVFPDLTVADGERQTLYLLEMTLQGETRVTELMVRAVPRPVSCADVSHRTVVTATGFTKVIAEATFPDELSTWPAGTSMVAYDEQGRLATQTSAEGRMPAMELWLSPPQGQTSHTFSVQTRVGGVLCTQFPVEAKRPA